MLRLHKFIFASLILCVASGVLAQVITKEEKRVFGGRVCIPKPSCLLEPSIPTLKEFGFWVRKWRTKPTFKGDLEVLNSTLYAWYETVDLGRLEDFAFVQYVRGCVYSSQKNKDGDVSVHYNITHANLGERKLFIHTDWVVDSPKSDPMYDSNPAYPLRHYFLEWNKTPLQFPRSHGLNFGDTKPKLPRLFILSSPSMSAYIVTNQNEFATNHSLEYRTCLYRTSEIPESSDGKIIPGALGCFEWNSSNIYDHTRRRFSSPEGIVPACRPEKLPTLSGRW